MIPVSPDCHGIENSRFGSNGGDFSLSMMFASAFGIVDLSNFWTYPSRIMRSAIQSVTTWMSRPPELPWSYCWRTFPKNWSLSFISSTYLTLVPYFSWNFFSAERFSSMYNGQFAKYRFD